MTQITFACAKGHGSDLAWGLTLVLQGKGGPTMMLAYRLVRLIEKHSDALAVSLLERVRDSEFLPAYRKVPPDELKQRVSEIYRHLGEWLLGKTEFDIEQRYKEIGQRRAEQGVPLSQLTWTIILTKENLWAFLKRESVLDRPVEVFGEMELLTLLDRFFDRALYYAAVGYERIGSRRETAGVAG